MHESLTWQYERTSQELGKAEHTILVEINPVEELPYIDRVRLGQWRTGFRGGHDQQGLHLIIRDPTVLICSTDALIGQHREGVA